MSKKPRSEPLAGGKPRVRKADLREPEKARGFSDKAMILNRAAVSSPPASTTLAEEDIARYQDELPRWRAHQGEHLRRRVGIEDLRRRRHDTYGRAGRARRFTQPRAPRSPRMPWLGSCEGRAACASRPGSNEARTPTATRRRSPGTPRSKRRIAARGARRRPRCRSRHRRKRGSILGHAGRTSKTLVARGGGPECRPAV